jgi:hypothetical protein
MFVYGSLISNRDQFQILKRKLASPAPENTMGAGGVGPSGRVKIMMKSIQSSPLSAGFSFDRRRHHQMMVVQGAASSFRCLSQGGGRFTLLLLAVVVWRSLLGV